MTQVQELRLIKPRHETIVDTCTMVLVVAAAYYISNPDAYERDLARVRGVWDRVLYIVSVRQALGEIQSLPETPEK